PNASIPPAPTASASRSASKAAPRACARLTPGTWPSGPLRAVRAATLPPRRLLVGVGQAQERPLREGAGAELEADGQPIAREAARQRDRRQAGGVVGPGQAGELLASGRQSVAQQHRRIADGWGRDRDGGAEQDVDLREQLV